MLTCILFKPIISYDISEYLYVFKIFDRWGNNIFETNQYNVGWDGTDLNNKKLPTGVYSYVLQVIHPTENSIHNINTSGKVILLK